MKWYVVTGILCSYGFFKEFKPVEPFLTPYLVSPPKNFTDDELYSEVYPVWTYSYLAALVPVFLLTDLLRYNPVILWESLSFITTWVLLLWGRSVLSMQFMQFAYGWATATEIAYYAYIYTVVEEEKYQRVTSYVRAAVQGGKCLAYALGQILISSGTGSYFTLNYISLGSMVLIFFIACALPWVGWRGSPLLLQYKDLQPITYRFFAKLYFKNLYTDFKSIYSSTFLLKWSIWWALATCGFYQIGNYIQTLWETMQTNRHDIYNGVTEAINTFLGTHFIFSIMKVLITGTITILCMQFVHVRWEKWGEIALAITAGLDCTLLILMSQIHNLILSYIFYVIFRVLYQMMITIAQYNLARKMKSHSFGLVFGFNTFMALVLQTILTIAVADHHGLHLEIHTQFVIYGVYHGIIGAVFLIMGFYTLKRSMKIEVDIPIGPEVFVTQPSRYGTNAIEEPVIDESPMPRRKKRKHRKRIGGERETSPDNLQVPRRHHRRKKSLDSE